MNKVRLLVADDIRDIRDFLRHFLEPEFDVVVARNGEEAWELFNSEKPDMVLSDCVMPRINGIELLKKIRLQSFQPETPVLMITAATAGSDLADGLWSKISGCDGFISKPFGPQQVLDKVAELLAKRPPGTVRIEPEEDAFARL